MEIIGTSESVENSIDVIIAALEKKAGVPIFTLRILDKVEEGLEVIAIFENKTVLLGLITIINHEGKLACRVQANFI